MITSHVPQGAKLQYGRVPLYVSGEDASARQFPSLHAVQRHMADTGRFKMAWEDNEEEYADFYDFGDEDMEEDAGGRVQCPPLGVNVWSYNA